jgi:hypothetical protein
MADRYDRFGDVRGMRGGTSRTRPGTYTVHVACTNCDHWGSIDLPHGEPFGSKRTCPRCGCDTLARTAHRSPRLAANG